jgi:hypothetical protein
VNVPSPAFLPGEGAVQLDQLGLAGHEERECFLAVPLFERRRIFELRQLASRALDLRLVARASRGDAFLDLRDRRALAAEVADEGLELAQLDQIEATPTRFHVELPWEADAKAALDQLIDAQPVLVRISAAKRLRDTAERGARQAGETLVTQARLETAHQAYLQGRAA